MHQLTGYNTNRYSLLCGYASQTHDHVAIGQTSSPDDFLFYGENRNTTHQLIFLDLYTQNTNTVRGRRWNHKGSVQVPRPWVPIRHIPSIFYTTEETLASSRSTSRSTPCRLYGTSLFADSGQSDSGAGFSPSPSVFARQYHSTDVPYSPIYRGRTNGPVPQRHSLTASQHYDTVLYTQTGKYPRHDATLCAGKLHLKWSVIWPSVANTHWKPTGS